MGTLKHEEIRTTTNGETIVTSKRFSVKTTSESFYMTFFDNMASFFKIQCMTDVKILAKFCALAEYNTGKVNISAKIRKDIIENIGISTQNFSNSITRLRALGLINGDKGEYNVNPKVFWKGNTNERDRLLKEQGIEININFKQEDHI